MEHSIIIPFHSNRNLLLVCLDKLLETVQKDTEIIIVANNPDFHELNFCVPDRCTLLKFEESLYYPKAVNIGAKYAHGEYLVLMDADICVCDGWLEAFTTCFEQYKNVGGCSAKMLDPYSGRVKEFGIGFSGYNFPHPFEGQTKDDKMVSEDREVQAFCSAVSMYRRSVFLRLGGMDEGLIDGYSDIDFCLRLHAHGLHTYVVANAVAYHHGSSTFGSGMSSHLRTDTKGYFMSHCTVHPQVDMDVYFQLAFRTYPFPLKSEYYLIDFTTIANRQWHYDLIAKLGGFVWSDVLCRPYKERDASHIPLYTLLDDNIRRRPQAICYFVDSFCSLQHNWIWKDLRVCKDDLVIDRNANIFRLSDII